VGGVAACFNQIFGKAGRAGNRWVAVSEAVGQLTQAGLQRVAHIAAQKVDTCLGFHINRRWRCGLRRRRALFVKFR
jgi:hypothetical protein